MNIGLYFGSFNPIHNGHLIIANYIAQNTDLDQVWLVVSPQNPLKPQHSLLNEYDRLHLVKLAIDGEKKLKASDIEFKLPKPSYTVNTLSYLKEKFTEFTFHIIMGSDSFMNLQKWKNYETLIQNHSIYIYRRVGFDVVNTINASIQIVDAPLLEISSTVIRNMIANKQSFSFWVPDAVKEEIALSGYYKKKYTADGS